MADSPAPQRDEIDYTADDLFAGAGGWDLAARPLGIHARGVENMKEARATRDAAGLSTIHDDVWTFVPDGKASGLIASPPCQTFSAAGKGAGRQALDQVMSIIRSLDIYRLDRLHARADELGDPRTGLVLTPLHFALSNAAYQWLAWEQVPAVLPVWEACAERLRAHGWSVWTGLLQGEMFGVPQTRKRAFLLASRNAEVKPPTPTHSRYYSRDPGKLDMGVEKWVSMAEALGWSQGVVVTNNVSAPGNSKNRAADNYGPYTRSVALPSPTITSESGRWFISEGGDDRSPEERRQGETITSPEQYADWVLRNNSSANAAERTPDQPAPTLYFGQRSNYCAWEWRGEGEPPVLPEWAFNRPSTTIVGSFKPEIVAAPGYRTTISRQNAPDSVRVTVEEAGVLQSFPHNFPWQGAKGKQFLQCGNAVPPLLALHGLAAASGIAIERREEVA